LITDSVLAVRRQRLCGDLRKARRAADLTQEQVAAGMDWSVSKLIRIESGSVTVSINDFDALIRYYKIEDDALVELAHEARTAQRNPWISTVGLVYSLVRSLVVKFAPRVRAVLGHGRKVLAALSAKITSQSGWVGSCWEAPARALRRRTRRRRRTARSLAGRLEDRLMQPAMRTGSGRRAGSTGTQGLVGHGSGQVAMLWRSLVELAAI
jgi:transcriptional regulator with XRE-family HTH domain